MKNMTLKEFKETLKGTQFENVNLEDLLNSLSILCDREAEQYEKLGLKALAEHSRKDATTIYERLVSKGYYETK